MFEAAVHDIWNRWFGISELLGSLLYVAACLFFIQEFTNANGIGMIRSPQYLVFTFIICIFALIVLSMFFQMVHNTSLYILILAFSFGFLALIEQSFSIFPLTELSCFSGFLFFLNSKPRPKLGLSLSLMLILLYLLSSFSTLIMGKNMLINDAISGQKPILRFAGSIFLGSIAIGTLLAQGAFRRSTELEKSLQHLDTTLNQLSKINQDLQSYARTIDEEAISRERNRISREIHDISGYRFTNVIALMDAAISMGGRDPDKLQELYFAARTQARDGLLETRRALRALRTDEQYITNGIPAIYKICAVFHQVTGIDISIESGNIPTTFGPEIDLAVYRLVQEALTNAMRHGRASAVKIYFWIHYGTLEIIVQDNGLGAQQVVKGIGLSGMEERLGNLGGTLETGSVPEGGFRLKVQIPIKKEHSI